MALPTHHKGVSQMHQKKPAVFAVMASLLALVVAISWTLWKLLPQKAVITKGIAVLPFENLSPDPDNAYFTEGIHEEILGPASDNP
jgi:hypothetical protein